MSPPSKLVPMNTLTSHFLLLWAVETVLAGGSGLRYHRETISEDGQVLYHGKKEGGINSEHSFLWLYGRGLLRSQEPALPDAGYKPLPSFLPIPGILFSLILLQ